MEILYKLKWSELNWKLSSTANETISCWSWFLRDIPWQGPKLEGFTAHVSLFMTLSGKTLKIILQKVTLLSGYLTLLSLFLITNYCVRCWLLSLHLSVWKVTPLDGNPSFLHLGLTCSLLRPSNSSTVVLQLWHNNLLLRMN